MVGGRTAQSMRDIPKAVGARVQIQMQFLVLIFVWMVFTAGVCEMVPSSKPIRFDDVLGAYGATFHAGKIDSLWLRQDSVWVRRYETWDGREYVDSGKYLFEFRSSDRDRRYRDIYLYNFVTRFDNDSADTNSPLNGPMHWPDSIPSIWFVPVHMSLLGNDTIVRLGGSEGPCWRKFTYRPREK
jgi:hypothetical protein